MVPNKKIPEFKKVLFSKFNEMLTDIEYSTNLQNNVRSEAILGDARQTCFLGESFNAAITSKSCYYCFLVGQS
ncbi:unnamed protein product [marine sediment metagenome]|uniref:Uncharacterized protein n=1 Tax=marine sediment metagenome TaxID=412755 RepID=X0ZEF5_9ZZZZ